MLILFKREFKSYFLTATGYLFIGIFLLLSGICFGIINLASRSTSMLYTLQYMGYIWMLLCPVLVIRLIAGERQKKTDQLLFSSPCSVTSIVIGKYFAAVAVMLIAVAATCVYIIIIMIYGRLYAAETFAGYIGFILQGAAYIALDLFISCMANHQVNACIFCIGANLFFWISDLISDALPSSSISGIFSFVSLYKRFEDFGEGRISFSGIIFYLLFIVTLLFLSVRALDARRWSNT